MYNAINSSVDDNGIFSVKYRKVFSMPVYPDHYVISSNPGRRCA